MEKAGKGAACGGGSSGAIAADSGKHIEAFSLEQVLEEKKVVCLETWGQYILVGLSDGTLLLASQRSLPAADSRDGAAQQPEPRWTVVQSLRGFATGQVKQLQVAQERSMLLCLADDGVNAFVLPGLRLKGQAGRTRGASLFAWHSGGDVLAVASKRRLALFKYDGLEFVFQREAALPDTPVAMRIAGGTALYAGLARREYVAVDLATGAVTQLFATGGPAAALAFVSNTEVLLARDSSGVLFGPDGRPSKANRGAEGAVSWSAPPALLGISGPYAVALTEAGAEARLLRPLNAGDPWQQLALVLPDAATTAVVAPTTSPDGSLFVASRATGSITQLRPVSFAAQARQMLLLGEHEEALALAALLPPSQAQQRRELEDAVHLSFGRQLFREGAYEEALAHLGMSGLAGPLQLLRLFPSLAPPNLLAAAAAEQAEGTERGGGEASAQPPASEDEEESVAEPQGAAFQAAVQVLLPYLLSQRSRLAAAASPAKGGGGPPDGGAAAAERAASGALPPLEPELDPSPSERAALVQRRLEGSAAAALLDTALLLALLALPDSGALLRFAQRANCVDLEAGEAALRRAGRYSELVALYQSKRRHSAALELLRTLSQAPEQLPAPAQGASADLRGLPGVWAAVKYVCQLPEGERDLALISTHAKWMLHSDPDAGLEMFGSMDPPLAPSAVLPMLTTYAPQLAGTYLEGALASGAADPAAYEQELARIYLERIAAAAQAPHADRGAGGAAGGDGAKGGPAAAEGQAPSEAAVPEYDKLQQLILSSCHLDYEGLLLLVPQRLLGVRAALLERLGRHIEALRILIHRLHQPAAAEAYCDRVYQRRQQQLREQRHAELAAALRRQRTAAAASAGGGAAAVPGRPPAAAAPAVGGAGSDVGGPRTLQRGGGSGGSSSNLAGHAGTRLQAAGGSSEDGADIYLMMVQVLLEEADGGVAFRPVQHAPHSGVWGEVARLLSRKRDAIQPLHALGLLPGEVPLSSALPFLQGALWGGGERRRAAAIARSLHRAEQVALLGELADARQRSILLTPERNCSICYKRIGTAALVAFPWGLLAHYSCHRRASGAGGTTGGTQYAANGRPAAGVTAGTAGPGGVRGWA